MKKLLAALLCLAAVLTLFSASAMAAYSTTSNTGDELVYPEEKYYYKQPFEAKAKTFEGGNGIFIIPMPEAGHGYIGSVASGKTVTVLAEKNGFFFFVSSSGHLGWNGMCWFDYDEKKVGGKYGGEAEPVDYPLFSTKGARLVFPADAQYFDEPLTKTVKASRPDGGIYLMPMPEKNHGNIGTVADGATVTILAEQGEFYFFQTADGLYGWNTQDWFI